jgi:hypothetical protein
MHRRFVPVLLIMIVFGFPTTARPQSVPIGWIQQGDGAWFDDCPGNCGAGCRGYPNVCGGSQRWEATILGPAEEVDPASSWWEDICPTGTYVWRVRISVARAWASWRYIGLWSDGCRAHDDMCRSSWPNPIDCWLTAPAGVVCTGATTRVWGPHEDWIYGYFMYDVQKLYDQRCSRPTELRTTDGALSGPVGNPLGATGSQTEAAKQK